MTWYVSVTIRQLTTMAAIWIRVNRTSVDEFMCHTFGFFVLSYHDVWRATKRRRLVSWTTNLKKSWTIFMPLKTSNRSKLWAAQKIWSTYNLPRHKDNDTLWKMPRFYEWRTWTRGKNVGCFRRTRNLGLSLGWCDVFWPVCTLHPVPAKERAANTTQFIPGAASRVQVHRVCLVLNQPVHPHPREATVTFEFFLNKRLLLPFWRVF